MVTAVLIAVLISVAVLGTGFLWTWYSTSFSLTDTSRRYKYEVYYPGDSWETWGSGHFFGPLESFVEYAATNRPMVEGVHFRIRDSRNHHTVWMY